jgi:hypothetical protein
MIDSRLNVNRNAYMTFREATDSLFACIGHEDLARALGVSVASIRQARLKDTAKSHRAPRRGWEAAVISLAKQKITQYQELIAQLEMT